MTILWLSDRFGMPGQYRRMWVRALAQANLRPMEFEVVSLHQMIQGQLLMRLGSRKAPTWVPDMGERITTTVNRLIQQHKPQAVVLAAPEALACLGLAPEHSTLHNLRGSVYWRMGIPHLVTLPISAWNTMVTQKDIGAANYGFESAEKLSEARQAGEVPQQASGEGLRVGNRTGAPVGMGTKDGDAFSQGSIAGGRRESPSSGYHSAGSAAHNRTESQAGSQRAPSGIDSGNHRHPGGLATLPSAGSRILAASLAPSTGSTSSSRGAEVPGVGSPAQGQAIPDRADSEDHDRFLPDHSGGGDLGSVHSAGEGTGNDSAFDPDDRVRGADQQDVDDPHDRRGAADVDSGEAGDDEGDEPSEYPAGSPDEYDVPDDSGSESPDTDGIDAVADGLDNDEEIDQFFYEPVLSPVGRFVITADLAKLKRILIDGKTSQGPANPLVLHWHGD